MNKFIVLFLLLIPIAADATPISPIIPFGTTLPATCRTGSLFIDTDADTDGALYQCVTTDNWKLVSSAAGSVDTSGTPEALDIARFTDDNTIEGLSYSEFISALDADFPSIVGGITGLVKGLGDGNGYEAAVDGTDYLSPTLASNVALNDKYLTETETSLTDSDAPSPNLSGDGTYFEFTDDATADVDSITGFTNFPSDTWVTFRFEDVYWTVDFSQANLYGHGNLLWTPRAGDSMICRSHDGTKIECIVSMPTALAISQVYHLPVDSTPDSDDSWVGTTAEFLAGETLAQWDLVYMSHDTGTSEIKKWDADLATYKYYKPIGVVIESGGIADTATGTVGILGGIARNDGWTAFADNADEGKTVYGTTTPGAMSDTAPAVSGDIVCAVGIVLDDDEIMFNFGLCASVEVP